MKCELCGRENILTFHHFIPVCLHTNKWFKNHFTREEMRKGVDICQHDCHKQIHIFVSEKELGKNYNTLEKLKKHPKIRKYLEYIKNQ